MKKLKKKTKKEEKNYDLRFKYQKCLKNYLRKQKKKKKRKRTQL